jgi:hypothetical protein
MNRRDFLRTATGAVIATTTAPWITWAQVPRGSYSPRRDWSFRTVQPEADAPYLAAAYEQTRALGVFPHGIENSRPISVEQMRGLLEQWFNSQVVLLRDEPMGFISIGDLGPPGSAAKNQTIDPDGFRLEMGVIRANDLHGFDKIIALGVLVFAAGKKGRELGVRRVHLDVGENNPTLVNIIHSYMPDGVTIRKTLGPGAEFNDSFGSRYVQRARRLVIDSSAHDSYLDAGFSIRDVVQVLHD